MAPDAPAPASVSGLTYALHPLVLINISDHHTRLLANRPASEAGGPPPTCLGILLGTQVGRAVDVSNSFETPASVDAVTGAPLLNEAVLAKKLDQYKQTFPDLDVVGWYATCPGPTLHPPFHGPLHNAVATLNEAAVGLLVDPSSAAPAAAPAGGALTAPLPIRLYERVAVASSGGGGDAAGAALPPPGGPSASFNLVPFSVEASEAERIGVAQAARTLPPGSTGGAAILAAHYRDLAGAVGGLAARVEALAAALAAQSTDPTTPPPRALARSAAALAARLPAAAGPAFCTAFATEQVDVLTTILLATVTRGTALTAELVAKLNAAYEPPVTPSMLGGGGGGGGGGRPMMASRMGGGGGGMMEGRWPQHEPLDRDFPGGGGGSGPRRGRRGAQ